MGIAVIYDIMKRTRILLIFLIALVLALATAFTVLNFTEGGNAFIAENFVKNEATYKFDGIPETFRSTGTTSLECLLCREFSFEYQSRNSGYGDRKGIVVASVITLHKARVVVERGTISSAILDDIWDMKAQKSIDIPAPPGDSEDEEIR